MGIPEFGGMIIIHMVSLANLTLLTEYSTGTSTNCVGGAPSFLIFIKIPSLRGRILIAFSQYLGDVLLRIKLIILLAVKLLTLVIAQKEKSQ